MTDGIQSLLNGSGEPTPLVRITRIIVEDLFGLYDHDVTLNSQERVTIIHGPNGVGKTVLLKLVNAIFNGDYLELAKTPFSTFRIEFDDKSSVSVMHLTVEPSDLETTSIDIPLIIEFSKEHESESFTFHLSQQTAAQFVTLIDRQISWIHRMDSDTWVDQRTGETLTAAEVVVQYIDRLPANLRGQIVNEPAWIVALRQRVSVYLIETQRLLRELAPDAWRPGPYGRGATRISTVNEYANAIWQRIQETQSAYANISQQLDQSFPQRLISGSVVPLDTEELKGRINELETQRATLAEIGLMDSTQQFNIGELDRLPEAQRPAMTLFLSDSSQKLATLEGLARRITDFLEIVNKRFKNKRIVISRTHGMQARTTRGRFFDLDALSSGEQHELILSYDLLFNVRPNTFVMIDEPEISLHITWQKSFLGDLLRIVETSQIDVLLATHSPYIAGDRDDLMVALVADVE